ncbi:MAG: N-acetylmuramoyl-L-alanine amidase [Flavobacteriales bacterium]|nr:N-acetylmuramoyl-L-alanine amidase [Flavobacteriales bacterium]
MKTAIGADPVRISPRLLSRSDAIGFCGALIQRPKVAKRNRGIRMGNITRAKRWMAAAMALLGAVAQTLPQSAGDPNAIDVICLDAGHGGKDPGNLGTGRFKNTEKQIALKVTKLVGNYISKNFPSVKVVYTREDDRFIELDERCNIANRAKADVFISIHCNANDNHDPHGTESFVMGLHKTEANMRTAMKENASILLEEGHALKYDGYDPKDPESMIALSLRQNAYIDHGLLLSAAVQRQFKERTGRLDRGVKQAGFLVISYTTMPAILIELGFLTNNEEEDYLQSEKGQEQMASSIYRAFKEYKAEIEGTDVKVDQAEPDSTAVDTSRSEPKLVPLSKDSGVRFKVQITTTSKRMELKPKNFKGLEGVEEVKGNDLWKYTVGNERTLDAARAVQNVCREKGYDGCFIVAFDKSGQRIPDLQQAVTLTRDF